MTTTRPSRHGIMTYIQLQPESALPDISRLAPFRCVVVVEDVPTSDWQTKVSCWLVRSGCLYMMAWGNGCSSWDDSVDMANLAEFNYEAIPEDRFVMTTWHKDDSMSEVFWFSKNCAHHADVDIQNTVILHISAVNRESDFRKAYEGA